MEKIANQLITWYKGKKRDLPWRKNRSPYRVWISEIILQQTKVQQGKRYFNDFIQLFPDVNQLAMASQTEVLKAWEGLGYYSRARNLHATAKHISENLKGVFPTEHQEILQLKGIGKYTAGAIMSFAWNKPYPAIDGNTIRVITRLFKIETAGHLTSTYKHIDSLIREMYLYSHPKELNEAIIELGALVCTPTNPQCTSCPLHGECIARQTGSIGQIPKTISKRKPKERHLHFIIIKGINHTIYIEQRNKKDIWNGLYTPYLIEEELDEISEKTLILNLAKEGIKPDTILKKENKIHKLTHQTLHIHIWETKTKSEHQNFIPMKEVQNYPTPKPFIDLFKKIEN
ncbi:A/G-specific adenine glycosylase [Halosquirtibacter laminarini]|uniref:A/G-specific adenine glycosylase n=1 Tax=Halosquirtibacter laminarini TaxID=3374600 RepID=A0AC61NGF3_9BACT|nr:A/G-specific adenine glycosylase [Prolixibacteraceae bacterium]